MWGLCWDEAKGWGCFIVRQRWCTGGWGWGSRVLLPTVPVGNGGPVKGAQDPHSPSSPRAGRSCCDAASALRYQEPPRVCRGQQQPVLTPLSPCRCAAGGAGAKLPRGPWAAGTEHPHACPGTPGGNASSWGWWLRPHWARDMGGTARSILQAPRVCPYRCSHLGLSLPQRLWTQCTGKTGLGKAKPVAVSLSIAWMPLTGAPACAPKQFHELGRGVHPALLQHCWGEGWASSSPLPVACPQRDPLRTVPSPRPLHLWGGSCSIPRSVPSSPVPVPQPLFPSSPPTAAAQQLDKLLAELGHMQSKVSPNPGGKGLVTDL